MVARTIRLSITALPHAAASVMRRLRAIGLRPTAARVQIVQAIEAANAPLTADDLFRSLVERGVPVALGTTYRALSELASAGLLLRVWVEGHAGAKAVYSMPANCSHGGPHAHRITCCRCGHSVVFFDPGLRERVCESAGLSGIGSQEQAMTITVECLGCAPTCSAHRHAAAAVDRTEACIDRPRSRHAS